MPTRILLAHPGEMGAALGAALVANGHAVHWLPQGRSRQSAARARAAGLTPVDSAADCDVVISICPPSAALETAHALGPVGGTYVDANAISPATANEVAAVVTAGGAAYVDGGVIGPPPTSGSNTRLYVSGDRADDIRALFAGSVVDVRVLQGDRTAASALKMTYAAWTKISAALLLSLRDTAEALGVDAALVAEWELSQPDLPRRYAAARAAADAKAWRWAGEMEEIAATFTALGQPADFGRGAAAVYRSRTPR